MTAIKTIKRYMVPIILLVTFVYANYGSYTLYGSSIYQRNTPTEITVSDVKLDYSYITRTSRGGKSSKDYYLIFYHNNKKQYAYCTGYQKFCKEMKPYYVTEMTYLQDDPSHGFIKSMKLQPTDNASADPMVMNSNNNLVTLSNYLIELYERPLELVRWIFYITLMLIPLAIFIFFKTLKGETDD